MNLSTQSPAESGVNQIDKLQTSSLSESSKLEEKIQKINLMDFDKPMLIAFMNTIGEPKMRATQVLKWLHQFGVQDYDAMTDLPKSLRQRLKETTCCEPPEVVTEQISEDGTIKWLLKLHDGQCIETVYIPERDRGTLCVSSQVGCALDCKFCSTGKQGFNRHLSVGEIIGQLWLAMRRIGWDGVPHSRPVTNVVFMGMGEPLLNLASVIPAANLMLSDDAYGLSKHRVTVSTAGIVPNMSQLSEFTDVSLAVSLHAPNNELRNKIVPINRKYPIEMLMDACRKFFAKEPRRKVVFEYVMLAGVNDRPSHAKELVRLLHRLPCKVNLIPYNPIPCSPFECSSAEDIDVFQAILSDANIPALVRRTRGDDIDAACGQLVGEVKDRGKRKEQYATTSTPERSNEE